MSYTSVSQSCTETTEESSYIPIRVLGRGAYGEAVLYRKTGDNSLVVWKEVNLAKLPEKQKKDAQNEIDILSMLNHHNAIMYYNHFLDGEILLIEMEYANGGTLCHKVADQKEFFDEKEVVWYFYQLMSAVSHIHEYGILHRDIKTLNIFLTKSQLVKLGDFGISKMLSSNSAMAESYVGTPYYMSPELVRGEQYNQRSDIWACGCVLYELLTLKKTFDATNPLRLAAEIVGGDFDDVNMELYSSEIIALVNSMLEKDPAKRPDVDSILQQRVLKTSASEIEKKVSTLNNSTIRKKSAQLASMTDSVIVQPVVKAKSSEVYFWGGGKITPQKLEIFKEGKAALQVSAGLTHFSVVTVEKELYTWTHRHGGGEMNGELGHGDVSSYRTPKKVQAFEGQHVIEASCGDDFTTCLTDEGDLYAFGSNYYGCLGNGDESVDNVNLPSLIDFFTSRPVRMVSCGESHVAVLTRDYEVYTWGCGEFGRLGIGTEDDQFLPQRVPLRGRHVIRSVTATSDGTFLLTSRGRVLACGSNECNKLGFNNIAAGLRKRQVKISYDIPFKVNFSVVKPLSRFHIITLSAGQKHSAVIDLYGCLITFGSNKYGQLGIGDNKKRNGVCVVGGVLTSQTCVKVACGDGFTVVGTSDNQVYSFGSTEDGRLGMEDARKANCITFPRPIFGALHHVSDISATHWHTILIAEKILHQKTIRNSAIKLEQSDCYDEPDSAFFQGSTDEDQGAAARIQLNDAGSSVPPWLQAELDDEFIPIGGPSPVAVGNRESVSESPSSGVSSQGEIDSLRNRVEELESENKRLNELLRQQADVIRQLQQPNQSQDG